MTTTKEHLRNASYLFSLQYLKQKTFTIGEKSVKSCILSADKEVLGRPGVEKLERIPHSKDTVQRSIDDIDV